MERKIEANYKNLERVNNWISNSDTKAGVIVAFNGILFTYLIAKFPLIKVITSQRFLDMGSLCLYLIFIVYFVMLMMSVFRAFRAINPNIKEKIPSVFFFYTISQMDLDKFNKKMRELTTESIEEELINQTFVNSKIAATKFINLKDSLKYLFISMVFWALSLIFTFIL